MVESTVEPKSSSSSPTRPIPTFHLYCDEDEEERELFLPDEDDYIHDCHASSSNSNGCEGGYFSQIEKLPFIDDEVHEIPTKAATLQLASSSHPLLHLKIPANWDHQITWTSREKSSPTSSRCVQFDDFLPTHHQRFLSPYAIWKEKFMQERGCNEDRIFTELFWSYMPHLIINVAVCVYIILGAWMFQFLDDEIAKQPFFQAVLFTFTTITTIGYGNIVPTNHFSRVFCIGYIIVGVPLVFMALSQGGQSLAEVYWILVTSVTRRHNLNADDDSRLPLLVVLVLLLLHSFIGGLIYHYWIDEMPFVSAVYFGFISITTIGFGDYIPSPVNNFEAIVTIFYLIFGIVIMSTLIGALSNHLRKLHYIGRKRVDDAENVEVWFGGARLSIKELVHVVGHQFDVSPVQLRDLLHELDQILSLAFNHNPSYEESPNSSSTNVETPLENHQFSISKRSEKSLKTLSPSIFESKFEDREEHEKLIRALGTFHHISMSKNRIERKRSLSGMSSNRLDARLNTEMLLGVSMQWRDTRRSSLPPLKFYKNS